MVAAFVGAGLFLQASPRIEVGLAMTHWDVSVDRLTAKAFLEHYSPFTPEGAVRSGLAASGPAGNGHPPTTAFWFIPIARMSDQSSAVALAWFSVLLLMLELVGAMTALRYPSPLMSAWLFLTYILGCSFMQYHVAVGQISAVIGFLYFVGWRAGRAGDDWLAGAALGVACTLKLFPGVLVLMFLFAFRWRAVLAAIGVYAGVAIYMTAGFGIDSWRGFLAQQKLIADLWLSNIQNQSIHGVVLRLFQPVCLPHGPVLFKASVISSFLSLIILVSALWLIHRTVRQSGFDVAYALMIVLSAVTSQWTWEHYTVIYALPVLILAAELANQWRLGKRRIRAVGAAVILAAVVASWRIDWTTKLALQSAVHSGQKQHHLWLHIYDVLNWGPGIVLLLLLFVANIWRRQDTLNTPYRLLPEAGNAA